MGKISTGTYYLLKLLLGDEELSRLTRFLEAIENRGKTTIFPATRMTRRVICRNQNWRLRVFGLEYYVNPDTWLNLSEVFLSAFRPNVKYKIFISPVRVPSLHSIIRWLNHCVLLCVTVWRITTMKLIIRHIFCLVPRTFHLRFKYFPQFFVIKYICMSYFYVKISVQSWSKSIE